MKTNHVLVAAAHFLSPFAEYTQSAKAREAHQENTKGLRGINHQSSTFLVYPSQGVSEPKNPPDLGREAPREGSGGGERLHQLLGRIVGEPPVTRQARRIGDNLRLL